MNPKTNARPNGLTKKLLSVTVILILLALAIWYFINNLHEFKQLSLTNLYLLMPIIIIFIINYIFLGLTNIYLLKPLNLNLGFLEGFQLAVINGFYNLITPFKGGMVAKALYLKKKHDFSYTNFLATLAASYVLIFLVASLVGMITMYFTYKTIGLFSPIIFLIFTIFFVPLLIIVIFSPKFPETKYAIINRFIKVINGWNLIKDNKKTVILVTLFSLIPLLLGSFGTYLSFMVFGIELSYISALFLNSVGSLGILIALTPAGLGVQEAIMVFSALTIGITPAQSLSVAVLGRIVQMIVMFTLGPIFSYILLKHKPKNERTNQAN